jgi:hypothetical protein
MGSATWTLTTAGWLAILAGAGTALAGLVLMGAMFFGGGVPVSAAGIFVLLVLGAGPLLFLAGVTMSYAGFKLMGGHAWALTTLSILAWIALAGSLAWLVYSAMRRWPLEAPDVVQGFIFLLMTAVPAGVLVALLRTPALQRAMTV